MSIINYQNLPSTSTPLNATNLNSMQGIAETITNSNGTAVKFTDGTMICYINKTTTEQAIDSQYGGSALYTGIFTWTFPVEFYAVPSASCGTFHWGTGASWGSVTNTTKTNATIYGYDLFSRATGTNCNIQAIAIGRWKA